jgi:hypothetical protein
VPAVAVRLSSGLQALFICEGDENKVGFSRNTYEIKEYFLAAEMK